MRSSNSKSGKSVSICNEAYPNGPTPKKEGEQANTGADKRCVGPQNGAAEGREEAAEDEVHAVACKVVKDLVRIAAQTASEKLAEAPESPSSSELTYVVSSHVSDPNQNPDVTISNGGLASISKAEILKEGEQADSGADERCVGPQNGAAEGSEEDIAEDRVHAVASKVVEDVVRIAAQTASDKRAEASESSSSSDLTYVAPSHVPDPNQNPDVTISNGGSASLSKAEKLKRVPTIQIDTVASLPSSPTEWQAPSKNDAIVEEEEDILDEENIQIFFGSAPEETKADSEVQDFAASYIKDIITKAMEIAEEKQRIKETEDAKEIATLVVEDVIARANDKAIEKLTAGLSFPDNGVPSIQVDTVPSLPPSPTWDEEEEQKKQDPVQNQTGKVGRKKPQFIFRDDEEDVKAKAQAKIQKLVKFSEAPVEIKDFTTAYVKDIISKAMTMAEEKLVSAVPFNFENVDLIKVSNPWYIRAREAFMRVLRSACFCTPRRHDS